MTSTLPQLQTYFTNTYLFASPATVVASGESEGQGWVAVSPNIFHPKGGGQPSDEGTLNGVSVAPSKNDSELVILTFEGELGELAPGTTVETAINSELRKQHAALHTAGHVIGYLGESRGWVSTGHSHYPGQARLDFNPEGLEAELATPELREQVLVELQAAVEDTLARGGAITSEVDATGRRTVTIEGVNAEPCGGTHVDSLAQLATVKILEVKVKRGALKVRYDAEHA